VQAFLESLRLDESVADWQVRQADDAIKLYLGHYGGRAGQLKSAQDADVDPPGASVAEKMRRALRIKHYSYQTEKSYLDWTRRFDNYLSEVSGRDLSQCEAADIRDYLAYLALQKKVSSSTQNQAFNALLFLMKYVLNRDTADLSTSVRAKRGLRLPVVLSTDEVKQLFSHLSGRYLVIAQLLYGSGLRLMEAARLRVQDVDFKMNNITVRSGKGDKDRTTIMSEAVKGPLKLHLEDVRGLHVKDLAAGYGEVHLAGCGCAQVPQCGKGLAMAVCLSGFKVVRRSEIGRCAEASYFGQADPDIDQGCHQGGGHRKTCDCPHAAPQLCYPPAYERREHPRDSGFARAQER